MSRQILIAEDNFFFADELGQQIESWGYTVVLATNGWKAYEILSDNPDGTFFAVVSDMRMPGGSGLMFCQAANRHGKCPPVLVHSSELSYQGDGISYKDISKLKEYFDFVQVTHLKPKFGNEFGYVKKFLDNIAA